MFLVAIQIMHGLCIEDKVRELILARSTSRITVVSSGVIHAQKQNLALGQILLAQLQLVSSMLLIINQLPELRASVLAI